MRFIRKSLVGLVLAALALALLGYAGQTIRGALQERMAQEGRAPEGRERVFAVSVVTAQQGTEVPTLDAFGQVQSRRTLELRASIGGRIVALLDGFEDGGTVATGALLARIDPRDAEAALSRARIDVQQAEAELVDARRGLDLARDEADAAQDQQDLRQRAFVRQQDLAGRGVGTEAAVEAAELAASSARQAVLARRQAVATAERRIEQAETGLARARIGLAEAERRLADTEIRAPFDGTLTAANVVEGRLVAANEKLAELVDPDALEVAFRISTAQYARLIDSAGALVGAPVTVALDVSGVDLRATGRISRASADAGETRSGRLVFARLDSARGFKPGDFVTVSVQEPALEGVVRLPAAAFDPAGHVLAVGAEDRLERLAVELVRRQGNDVLLRGDALAGREIVEAITPLLGEGIKVRPLRRDAPLEEPEMVSLSEERRARLVAFVRENARMPDEVKERVLGQLSQPEVPARMIARLESRMGG